MSTIESPAEEVRSANSPRNSAAYVVIAFLGIAVGFLLALLYFQKTAATPTTRELSAALGIRYWQFQIPDDVGDKTLGFEIHDGDSVKRSGGSSGWTPGEIVLVTVAR